MAGRTEGPRRSGSIAGSTPQEHETAVDAHVLARGTVDEQPSLAVGSYGEHLCRTGNIPGYGKGEVKKKRLVRQRNRRWGKLFDPTFSVCSSACIQPISSILISAGNLVQHAFIWKTMLSMR